MAPAGSQIPSAEQGVGKTPPTPNRPDRRGGYTALITFYSSAEGLYVLEEGRHKSTCRLLRLGHAALFIPWDDIHSMTIALAFEDRLRLDLGAPSVATFVVAETLWDKLLEDRLPTARGGPCSFGWARACQASR